MSNGIIVKMGEMQFRNAVDALDRDQNITPLIKERATLGLTSEQMSQLGLQGNKAACNVFIRGQLLQSIRESLSQRANEQGVKNFLREAEAELFGSCQDVIDQKTNRTSQQYSADTSSRNLEMKTVKKLLAGLDELRRAVPKFSYDDLREITRLYGDLDDIREVRLGKKGKLELFNRVAKPSVITTPDQNKTIRMQVCTCIQNRLDEVYASQAESRRLVKIFVKDLLLSEDVKDLPLTKHEINAILKNLPRIESRSTTVVRMKRFLATLRQYNNRNYLQESELTAKISHKIDDFMSQHSVRSAKRKIGDELFNAMMNDISDHYRQVFDAFISAVKGKSSNSKLKVLLKRALRDIVKYMRGTPSQFSSKYMGNISERIMERHHLSAEDLRRRESIKRMPFEEKNAHLKKYPNDADLIDRAQEYTEDMADAMQIMPQLEVQMFLKLLRDNPCLRPFFMSEPSSMEDDKSQMTLFSHPLVFDLESHSCVRNWKGTWDSDEEQEEVATVFGVFERAGIEMFEEI